MAEYEILVPDWQDIVHIRPQVQISQADYLLHKKALREGRSSPLTADQLDTLRRRRARAQHAKKSPIPEPVKQIGKIMNALDDAQDFLSTIMWIGKPILRRLPARILPGLGWILTGLDIINVITAIGTMATTGITKKRTAENFLDVLHMRRGDRIKRAINWLEKGIFKTVSPKYKGLARAIKRINIPYLTGRLAEAAQTTEMLWGVGLQLGPVLGYIQEGIYGGIKAATGHTVNIKGPIGTPLVDKALIVLFQAPLMLAYDQAIQDDDMLAWLAAYELAWDVITEEMTEGPGGDDLNPGEDCYPLISTEDPTIADIILDEFGVEDYHNAINPFTGTDSCITIDELALYVQRETPEFFNRQKQRWGMTQLGNFTAIGVFDTLSKIIPWLNPDHAEREITRHPYLETYKEIGKTGIQIIPGFDSHEYATWFDKVGEICIGNFQVKSFTLCVL